MNIVASSCNLLSRALSVSRHRVADFLSDSVTALLPAVPLTHHSVESFELKHGVHVSKYLFIAAHSFIKVSIKILQK